MEIKELYHYMLTGTEEQNDAAIDVLGDILGKIKKRFPDYYHAYDKRLEEIYNHHVMSVEEARDYVRHFVNKDGTTGAHWTMEQTKNYQATHEEVEDLNPVCFYVAMNMMYSDYYQPERKTDTYAILAKDFLEDEDAPKDKLKRYLKAMHS